MRMSIEIARLEYRYVIACQFVYRYMKCYISISAVVISASVEWCNGQPVLIF